MVYTWGGFSGKALELVMLILLKFWRLIREFCLTPIYSFCAALVRLCCCWVYTTYHGPFKSTQGTCIHTYSSGTYQFQTLLSHFKPLKSYECFLASIERQWLIHLFHHHLQEVWKFCITKGFYCRFYMITCSMNLKINLIHVNYSLMTHCNKCDGWVGVLFIIL